MLDYPQSEHLVWETRIERALGLDRVRWSLLAVAIGMGMLGVSVATALLPAPILGDPVALWLDIFEMPVLITFILLSQVWVQVAYNAAIGALEPFVDTGAVARGFTNARRPSWRGELLSVAVGACCGWLLFAPWKWLGDETMTWRIPYLVLAEGVFFGGVGWIFYQLLLSVGFLALLQDQVVRFTVFDAHRLRPIGAWALRVAILPPGVVLISLLMRPGAYAQGAYLVGYGAAVGLAAVVFVAGNWSTHRMMWACRREQLDRLRKKLKQATVLMEERDGPLDGDPEWARTTAALLELEQRVYSARTWPYDLRIIQGLLASLLLPMLIRWATN